MVCDHPIVYLLSSEYQFNISGINLSPLSNVTLPALPNTLPINSDTLPVLDALPIIDALPIHSDAFPKL